MLGVWNLLHGIKNRRQKMNAFEEGILAFVIAALPATETLFIHNQKSMAIFGAGDELATGLIAAATSSPASAPASVVK
jgi:hypothetical protein